VQGEGCRVEGLGIRDTDRKSRFQETFISRVPGSSGVHCRQAQSGGEQGLLIWRRTTAPRQTTNRWRRRQLRREMGWEGALSGPHLDRVQTM